MTFDSWTSQSGDPFLSVTGHYINAPIDKSEKWALKSEQLTFEPIKGDHSGENIARILIGTIDKYEFQDRVSDVVNAYYDVLTYCLGWLVYCRQCIQQ